MVDVIVKWFRKTYSKLLHSVAFLPALMGIGFLLLAIVGLEMDEAGLGLEVNKQFKWLTLKDAETARTIVATIAGSIISLMVFSFSMVMVLINQAASQMSNRMLGNIIGDKVQKIILGFYIGTIVVALFLLINISESENATNVPSLSVYFLLLLTVFDIFLFIYFLNYITHLFRYEQLIQLIHDKTIRSLNKLTKNSKSVTGLKKVENGMQILSTESGYFQGFNEKRLLKFLTEKDLVLEFLYPLGNYILKGTPLLKISGVVQDEELQNLLLEIDFYYGQEIDTNPYYGLFHLTEVAIKALSPAINDPGTAVISINALTDLFARILNQPVENEISDIKGVSRIIVKKTSFPQLFDRVMLPIWDYGNKDRMVQNAFTRMLEQLMLLREGEEHKPFLNDKLNLVNSEKLN